MVFLTPHTGQPENLKLPVSAFLYLFELTALLLKKINPHLRSNTIIPVEDKLVIRLRFHAYTDKCIVMKFSFLVVEGLRSNANYSLEIACCLHR